MHDWNDDSPLGEGGIDYFEHQILGKRIAELLRAAKTPSNLAIYGPWGSGKSSLLYLVEADLKKNSELFLWLPFDAWAYQSEDALVLAMLAQLFEKAKRPFRDSIVKIIKASALSMADIGLKVASLKLSSAEEIKKSLDLVEEAGSYESKHVVIKQQFAGVIEKLAASDGIGQRRKIILAVDNLDRCKPEVAIRVLETLFLVSDIPDCTLVVAVDQHVLISFLNQFYKGTNFGGSRYLEKVFPVAFRIPDPWVAWDYPQAVQSQSARPDDDIMPPDQVMRYLDHLLKGSKWDDRRKDDAANDKTLFGIVWHYLSQARVLRNPRRIKRIIRYIYDYSPANRQDGEAILFLVILSDLWPDIFEFMLSVDEAVWKQWMYHLGGGKDYAMPAIAEKFEDQNFRDLIYQIRRVPDPELSPITQQGLLLNRLATLRKLGL